MSIKSILDTNFLIDLFRFKIRPEEIESFLQEEVEFFTLKSVIRELEKISSSKGKTGSYAKLALKFLGKSDVKVLNYEREITDKALIDLAKRGYVIATNDINLRKKLKELKLKVIYLRGKKKIVMV